MSIDWFEFRLRIYEARDEISCEISVERQDKACTASVDVEHRCRWHTTASIGALHRLLHGELRSFCLNYRCNVPYKCPNDLFVSEHVTRNPRSHWHPRMFDPKLADTSIITQSWVLPSKIFIGLHSPLSLSLFDKIFIYYLLSIHKLSVRFLTLSFILYCLTYTFKTFKNYLRFQVFIYLIRKSYF